MLFRLLRLTIDDTVKTVQKTIHYFDNVISNYLSPRFLAFRINIITELKAILDEKYDVRFKNICVVHGMFVCPLVLMCPSGILWVFCRH
jgi:hypothetical protein